ncbi:hypothetical protein ACFCVO_10190 [Agromyces sp. NPDC056379]|uniref:hypothetical protein n=1 Tax=unclassified Agromyces TaxID=2639701 RepID=UPI0035D96D48
MYTTKTGAAAIGAVALLVALSACAGVRGNDPEPAAGHQQSQQQLQDTARRESAAMRAELHARDGAASVPSAAVVEGVRTAKQAEARSHAESSSAAVVEGVRTAKQAEARSDAESLRQHQLEHGASSDRLR